MRSLSILLVSLLIAGPVSAQVSDIPRIILPPAFAAKAGRYAGIITVMEKAPLPPSAALLPDPPAGSYLQTRASAQVTAGFSAGRIRVLGAPGSVLLGYLDEASFASVSIDRVYAIPNGEFVGFVAKSRKATGEVSARGDRIRLRFQIPIERPEFAAADQSVSIIAEVLVDLTRVGN